MGKGRASDPAPPRDPSATRGVASGFSFGFSFSNVPPLGYYYYDYDPSREARFSTLGTCVVHLHGHRHLRIVDVVSSRTGDLASIGR